MAIAENLEEGKNKRKNRGKKGKRYKGKRGREERKRDTNWKTEGMWRKVMIRRGREEEPKEINKTEGDGEINIGRGLRGRRWEGRRAVEEEKGRICKERDRKRERMG